MSVEIHKAKLSIVSNKSYFSLQICCLFRLSERFRHISMISIVIVTLICKTVPGLFNGVVVFNRV